jgi:hypothetical protein
MCCASDSGGTCAPAAEACPTRTSSTGNSFEVQCDDGADCPADEVCCVTEDSSAFEFACSTIEDCGGYESCIPGGSCSAGLTCIPDAAEFTGAKCVGAMASITCGSTTCVGGEFCCNDQSAVCVPPGSQCSHSYECDSPSDCGPGASCCDDGFGGSVCTWGACGKLTFCAMDTECPMGGTCSAQAGLDVPDGFQVCN